MPHPITPTAEDHDAASYLPPHPTDILLELIYCVLTPLFMAGCYGDMDNGRLAAVETIASYRPATQADLIKIAQIIGFGLAALDDLRLSMHPDVGLAQKMRLRGQANALNRSAQQNATSLERSRKANPVLAPSIAEELSMAQGHPHPDDLEPEVTEAELKDMVAATTAVIEQIRGSKPAAQPGPMTEAEQTKLQWAAAMNNVAQELQDDLPGQPAEYRAADRVRAAALGTAARDLLSSVAGRTPATPPGR
jgi:hypothetical protein